MMNVITLVDGTHVLGVISIQSVLPAADNAAIKEVLMRALVRMGHAVAGPLYDDQEDDHSGWGFFVEHDQIKAERDACAGVASIRTMKTMAEQSLARVQATDYKTPLVDPVAEQQLRRVLV